MKRKLAWFVIGFATMLLIFQTLIITENLFWMIVLSVAMLAASAIVVLPFRSVLPLLIGVLVACVWLPMYQWILPESPHVGSGENLRVVAVAEDYSYRGKSGEGFWCRCRVETINAIPQDGNMSINVYFRTPRINLKPGDRVEFDSELLPFENTDDFLEYTYYKTRFIDAQAFAAKYEVSPCEEIPIRYYPKVISKTVKDRIDYAFGGAAGLIRALIAGDRNLLTTRQTENFRVTGLSHVVSVSGMHVAFLTGFILLLFGRRRAPFIVTPIILLFGAMIGPTPSVIRAIFMQCAVLFAPLLKQEVDGVTSLAGALGLILFLNPYAILDVGLQLSFGATLGLILYAPKLNESLQFYIKTNRKFLRRILQYLVSTFVASVCAMIFTIPITMLSFGTFSLIAPISNILTLWSVSTMFIGGITVVILSLFSPVIAGFIGTPIKLLGRAFLWFSDLLAQIPYVLLDAKNPFVYLFVVYAYLLFFIVVYKKRRRPPVRIIFLLILIPLFVSVSGYIISARMIENVSASVLDVGQGLSVLIETTDETILVDCGSRSRDASQVVYDELLRRSDRTIDALVITHLDADHVNGVERILGSLRVSKLYLNGELPKDERFLKIQKAAEENGTELVLVSYSKKLIFANTELEFYPVREGGERMLAVNVSHNENDLLITGDMSEEGENYLLEWFDLPEVEYYVVGHHGSKTSSSEFLLDTIKPECALISLEKENQYGFPHVEVLEKLASRNIKILRTDEQGTVRVKF